jgi:phosphate-selective porin OprO/OprP
VQTGGKIPDESWGVNGRVTWEPIFEDGKILHVGAGSYYRWNLRSNDVPNAFRLSDRPNIRVDGGNIVDTGVIGGDTPGAFASGKVTRLFYTGAEAAGIYGPFTVTAEYNRLRAVRPEFNDLTFDGFYVAGGFFLTGETRPFKNGNFDRVKPFSNVGENGGWGAFEILGRYDEADFTDTPRSSLTSQGRAGNKAHSFTAGLTWYLNPYAKLLFNWVHFTGDRSALVDQISPTTAVPTPATALGTVKGDAFGTRLHFDW